MQFDEVFDALQPYTPPGQDRDFHRTFVWGLAQCAEMPESVQVIVYHIAASHGYQVALECVHQAAVDGITGPEPFDKFALVGLHLVHPWRLQTRLLGSWLLYILAQPHWRAYWTREARMIAIHLLSEQTTWSFANLEP